MNGHDRWRSRVRGLPETGCDLPASILAEEIETPGEGQVRAMVTVAGNPVLSTPNGRRLDRAMEQLEFMVSVDLYINETTRHADSSCRRAGRSPRTTPSRWGRASRCAPSCAGARRWSSATPASWPTGRSCCV